MVVIYLLLLLLGGDFAFARMTNLKGSQPRAKKATKPATATHSFTTTTNLYTLQVFVYPLLSTDYIYRLPLPENIRIYPPLEREGIILIVHWLHLAMRWFSAAI